MVDMAFVHGLEKAQSIIKERIDENKVKMDEFAQNYTRFCTQHPNDIFYHHLKDSYSKMYMEYDNENDSLTLMLSRIDEEIEKQMNVDAEEAV